ncbi:MAG: hypothetical protein D6683_11975 [Actinomyces sp.]|nr:MAG: hypothetical protein D6683_11975 [Actinomyces sp.]
MSSDPHHTRPHAAVGAPPSLPPAGDGLAALVDALAATGVPALATLDGAGRIRPVPATVTGNWSGHPHDAPLVGDRLAGEVTAVALAVTRPAPAAVAVGRDGRVVWRPVADTSAAVTACVLATDMARRALGAPTPPPPVPCVDLVDLAWLDRCLAAVCAAPCGSPPTWRVLSALHPLAAGRSVTASALRRRRARFAAEVDWEAVRRLVADGSLAWRSPAPAVAAWLDEGAFSRWVLADLPDPDEARHDLCALLDRADADRVARVLGCAP